MKRGDVTIEYCPTEDMIADFLTKPLQGSLFTRFRNAIMGVTDCEYIKLKTAYETSKRNKGSDET